MSIINTYGVGVGTGVGTAVARSSCSREGGQGQQIGIIVRHQHHLDARSDLADVLVQQQVVIVFQCFLDELQCLWLQPGPG